MFRRPLSLLAVAFALNGVGINASFAGAPTLPEWGIDRTVVPWLIEHFANGQWGTLATQDPTTGIISLSNNAGAGVTLEAFGGVADDATKGTVNDAAFAAACAFLDSMSGTPSVFPPPSTVAWRYPTLILRGGHQYTVKGGSGGIVASGCRAIDALGGSGKAQIVMDPTSAQTYMFNMTGSTRLDIHNVTFAQGKSALYISNANIDDSLFNFRDVEFDGQSAYPVVLQNAYSAVLHFNNTNWNHTNGGFTSQADVNVVDGASWGEPIYSNWTSNQGFFVIGHSADYHEQYLNLDDFTGVPDLYDGAAFHPGRWVDLQSAGNFRATRARFGGEFAGIPIVYYSGSYNTAGYLLGGTISVRDSVTYCGPSAAAGTWAGCIWLNGGAPMAIDWGGTNYGPEDVPIVNSGSLNITTYLAAWEAATSTSAENMPKSWVWSIDQSGFRSGSVRAYPDTAGGIVRTPNLIGYHTVGDADYNMFSFDRVITYKTTLTAARTLVLPPASETLPSTPIVVQDMAGAVSQTNYVSIAGNGSDTVDGAANYAFNQGYGSITLYSDGVSKWSYGIQAINRGGTGTTSINGMLTAFGLAAAAAAFPATGGVQITPVLTSALPTCNSGAKGTLHAVTDATAPTYNGALTGGGAVGVPVYCDGSAWKTH